MRRKTDNIMKLTELEQWGWNAWSKYPSKNGLMIDGKRLDKDINAGLFPYPPIEFTRVSLLKRIIRLLGL